MPAGEGTYLEMWRSAYDKNPGSAAVAANFAPPGSYRSPVASKDLLAHFDISGSVSDRAQSLIRAAGIDPRLTNGSLRVADPGLLVSRRRRELVDERDRALARK